MEKQVKYHDSYFRKMMANLETAKNFLRKYLPYNLQTLIEFDSLKLCKESYVDQDFNMLVTDILYSVNIQQQAGYIYFLVEHQSKPEVLMPFRMQQYILAIMRDHLGQTKKNILPVVVPMVFYNGEAHYPYSTDIFDLFGNHKNLAQELMFKPFQLIDLSKISDEELRKHTSLGLMEFVMKNIRARDFLPYMEMVAPELTAIEQIVGPDYIITTINYVMGTGNLADPEAFLKVVRNSLSPEIGEKLMTVEEYLIQKGMQQGIQLGRQEGRQEEAKHVACKLLIHGMNNSEISEITGLSVQEIIQLKVSEETEIE